MKGREVRKVLFLCTGNYYRSRFAETIFNWQACRLGLAWRAESRALGLGRRDIHNVGPLSRHVIEALRRRHIACPPDPRYPIQVCEPELAASDLIIALKEAEHRPLLEEGFPGWADRVEHWHVHDLDAATPAEALAAIEAAVEELIRRLADSGGGNQAAGTIPALQPAVEPEDTTL